MLNFGQVPGRSASGTGSQAYSQVQLVLPVVLVVRPLEHFVQLVLPAVAANVPTEQAVQEVLLVVDGTNPGLQQAHNLTFPVVGILHD
jgi:hypothetical protein